MRETPDFLLKGGGRECRNRKRGILTEILYFFGFFYFSVSGSPLVMKTLTLPASVLFCFLLLIQGLGAAPPGRSDAYPPPLGSEHKEQVAEDAVSRPKDGSAPEVRAARNSEPQDQGELFQGVDPRALAAVLLQALDRPASPPAVPGGSQQGAPEEAAEALLTESVRSQTHSLPAPEIQAPAAAPPSPSDSGQRSRGRRPLRGAGGASVLAPRTSRFQSEQC